jgi:N-acetylglucosaminyl-diphospho-decaprenol L-rhamnosyltransferase
LPNRIQYMRPFTISLVSHGQLDLCVNFLSQLDAISESFVEEVFLVHNLPEPQSLPHFKTKIIQIQNSTRMGFGANHNHVIHRVRTPFVAIVNPDIDLLANPFPAFLQTLHSDEKIGLVAPVVLNSDGSLANSMRARYTPFDVMRQMAKPGPVPYDEVVWFAGMFLVARTKALVSINGFDESYFMYCEDVDLSDRLRASGWTLRAVPDAKVLHHAQRASHLNFKATLMHLKSALRYWVRAAFLR